MKTLKSVVAIAVILCSMLIFSSFAKATGDKPDVQSEQSGTVQGEQSGTVQNETSALPTTQNDYGANAPEDTAKATGKTGTVNEPAAAENVQVPGISNTLLVINAVGIVLILLLIVFFRIIEARKMKSISEKVDKLFYYRNDAINDLKFQMEKLLKYGQNNAHNNPEERKAPLKTGWNPEAYDSEKDFHYPGRNNSWETKEPQNGFGSKSQWESKVTDSPVNSKEPWSTDNDIQEQPFMNPFSKNAQPKAQTKSELFLAQYNKYLSGEIRPQEFFNLYRPDDNIYLKVDVNNNREVQFISDQSQGQIHVFSHTLGDDQYPVAVLNKNEMSSFSTSNIRSMIEIAFDLNGIRDFVNERVICVKPAKIKKIKENMYQIVSKGAYKNA